MSLSTRWDPLNYLPVSFISIVCKQLELVVSDIVSYFDENTVLSDEKHCSRHERSRETQLSRFVEDLAKALDNL